MHRPWELRCGITLRQRYVDVGFPCRKRIGSPALLRCNAFDSRRSRCISIRTGSPLRSHGSRCSWIPESCVPLSHLARIKLAHRIEDRRGPVMYFFRFLCLGPLHAAAELVGLGRVQPLQGVNRGPPCLSLRWLAGWPWVLACSVQKTTRPRVPFRRPASLVLGPYGSWDRSWPRPGLLFGCSVDHVITQLRLSAAHAPRYKGSSDN